MLRNVANCKPEPFAAIVPATPDDRICVVDTGRPKLEAGTTTEFYGSPRPRRNASNARSVEAET
jgi:hypothetical protein